MRPATERAVEPAVQDILGRLRSETRLQHTQIEKNIPVFRKDLSMQTYVQILKSFYGYVCAMEKLLTPFLADMPGLHFEGRLKIYLLEEDLKFLGLTDSEIANIPQDPPLPEIRDVASSLGAMYVLEGSTLGGQIITGHLEKSLGITPETGGSYYAGYGAETRTQWKEFQAVLLRELMSESDQYAAILAAQQTFVTMDCWMSENLS